MAPAACRHGVHRVGGTYHSEFGTLIAWGTVAGLYTSSGFAAILEERRAIMTMNAWTLSM